MLPAPWAHPGDLGLRPFEADFKSTVDKQENKDQDANRDNIDSIRHEFSIYTSRCETRDIKEDEVLDERQHTTPSIQRALRPACLASLLLFHGFEHKRPDPFAVAHHVNG